MPRLRACLTAVSVFGLALASSVATRAAQYPVSTLTFGTDAINFGVGALNFPSGPVVTETATSIEVSLPADVLFDFDKSDIRSDAQKPLHEVAQLLRDKARGPVLIKGYTDALGGDAYNQRLSERRAAAVRTWLAAREGLASMKFITSGFGSRDPVAPNRNPDGSDNPAGRQMNRRVTFIMNR